MDKNTILIGLTTMAMWLFLPALYNIRRALPACTPNARDAPVDDGVHDLKLLLQ